MGPELLARAALAARLRRTRSRAPLGTARALSWSTGRRTGNITVVQPTTSAQYFHVLRAQAKRAVRRPLIVITPKFLLRAATLGALRIVSTTSSSGGFAEVLDDPTTIADARLRRLSSARGSDRLRPSRNGAASSSERPRISAVVRAEQLRTVVVERLASNVLGRYRSATELVWVQDEPENMGAWTYAEPRFGALVGDRLLISHVSRRAAGSPATGSHHLHDLELEQILDDALGAAAGA